MRAIWVIHHVKGLAQLGAQAEVIRELVRERSYVDPSRLASWMERWRIQHSEHDVSLSRSIQGGNLLAVTDAWGGYRRLFHALVARQGYLVVSFDNEGTPAPRGRGWRKSVYGGLGVLSSARLPVHIYQQRIVFLGIEIWWLDHPFTLNGIRWGFLAALFALAAAGLFSYLRNSRSVTQAQLYTAINIYLLLGLLWATLYLAIDAFSPGSIQMGSHPADRQTELLYFSFITLSTIGYGDIVPVSGEDRILAALEVVTADQSSPCSTAIDQY